MIEDQEMPLGIERLEPREVPSTRQAVDRRRPGRTGSVSPWLIPLLRFKPLVEQTAAPYEPPHEARPDQDADDKSGGELGIAHDIAFGLLLSIPFWLALAVFWLVD